MSIRDLVPQRWPNGQVTVHRDQDPFVALQSRMNQMLDDFTRAMSVGPFAGFGSWPTLSEAGISPSVDVRDQGKDLEVSADMPGLSEKDVQVTLSPDGQSLTIAREKRTDAEHDRDGVQWTERRFGSFYRVVPLPCEVKGEKVEAKLKDGVLQVRLPKADPSKSARRIKVLAE